MLADKILLHTEKLEGKIKTPKNKRICGITVTNEIIPKLSV